MNLFDNEKAPERVMMSSNNTTDSLKSLMQEQSQKLEIALSTNQELLQQNQKLQEENHSLQMQLYETQRLNQKLASENDGLRNRSGLMLRKQQEQLERKIEAVQVQNSRLNMLVDLSNVTAVEIAQKEKDAAFRVVEKEKRKAEVAKKKYQNEIKSRAKEEKKRSIKQKQEIRFWQCMTAIMLVAAVAVSICF